MSYSPAPHFSFEDAALAPPQHPPSSDRSSTPAEKKKDQPERGGKGKNHFAAKATAAAAAGFGTAGGFFRGGGRIRGVFLAVLPCAASSVRRPVWRGLGRGLEPSPKGRLRLLPQHGRVSTAQGGVGTAGGWVGGWVEGGGEA